MDYCLPLFRRYIFIGAYDAKCMTGSELSRLEPRLLAPEKRINIYDKALPNTKGIQTEKESQVLCVQYSQPL